MSALPDAAMKFVAQIVAEKAKHRERIREIYREGAKAGFDRMAISAAVHAEIAKAKQ